MLRRHRRRRPRLRAAVSDGPSRSRGRARTPSRRTGPAYSWCSSATRSCTRSAPSSSGPLASAGACGGCWSGCSHPGPLHHIGEPHHHGSRARARRTGPCCCATWTTSTCRPGGRADTRPVHLRFDRPPDAAEVSPALVKPSGRHWRGPLHTPPGPGRLHTRGVSGPTTDPRPLHPLHCASRARPTNFFRASDRRSW